MSEPDLLDPAVGPDQEGHATGALVLAAQEALLPPHPVGLDNLLVLVRHQRKRELVFLGELIVRPGGIDAEAIPEPLREKISQPAGVR